MIQVVPSEQTWIPRGSTWKRRRTFALLPGCRNNRGHTCFVPWRCHYPCLMRMRTRELCCNCLPRERTRHHRAYPWWDCTYGNTCHRPRQWGWNSTHQTPFAASRSLWDRTRRRKRGDIPRCTGAPLLWWILDHTSSPRGTIHCTWTQTTVLKHRTSRQDSQPVLRQHSTTPRDTRLPPSWWLPTNLPWSKSLTLPQTGMKTGPGSTGRLGGAAGLVVGRLAGRHACGTRCSHFTKIREPS